MINGNCGSCGGGAGMTTGMMGVILVPAGSAGAGTGTGTGGAGGGGGTGAPTSAPSVAYSPAAGSVLAGATSVGGALDKTADLLKLLNNAGFAAGSDGTIPVYDAATGKFEPTAAKDLLSSADMAALLKALYASGAPGAILQKNSSGDIVAVPFSTALAADTPGALNGQVLTYDAAQGKWVAGDAPPQTLAQLKNTLSTMPAGTSAALSSVMGLDAAGNPIKVTPEQSTATGIANSPLSTTANPASKVAAIDASGNPVSAEIKRVGETTVSSDGLTGPIVVPAGGVLQLASVTVPEDGVYAVSISHGTTRKFPTGGNTPAGAAGYGTVATQAYVDQDATRVYTESAGVSEYPIWGGSSWGAGFALTSLSGDGQVAIIKALAGQVVKLSYYHTKEGSLTATALDHAVLTQAKVTLTRLADNHLTVI